MTGEFLAKDIILSVFTAWFLSQVVLKIITFSYKKGRIFLNAAFMGGGMPSGHSTLVAALSTAVGLSQGFDSVIFLVTIVFSILVVYETMVTKRVLADFLKLLAEKHPRKSLLEELSHSLVEVIAGIAIGVVVVLIFYYR